MRRHFVKLILIGIVIQFSGCVRWPYRSVEVPKGLDARQVVGLWIKAAQLGDVKAIRALISDKPKSFDTYCLEEGVSNPNTRYLEDNESQKIGISPNEGETVRHLRANRDLEGPFSQLAVDDDSSTSMVWGMADYFMVNQYHKTSIEIVSQRTFGDESVIKINKSGFGSDFFVLFHLTRIDREWKIFDAGPVQNFDFMDGDHFAKPRLTCDEFRNAPRKDVVFENQ